MNLNLNLNLGSLWTTLALVAVAWPAPAAQIRFQSSERRTALVELYTSEGCSSCPPAEAWLSRLREAPGLWKDFVPVAYHVDYWDDLGWRDRWGARSFTLRQRSYARTWGNAEIYTPEFVLNGREWAKVSGIRTIPPPAGGRVGLLTVTSEDTNRWQVVFAPTTPEPGKLAVYAALLVGGLSSDVTRGENTGRRLEHDFVVLKLANGGMLAREGVLRSAFVLPWAERNSTGRLALAVWVTRTNGLEPLQATGGWLGPLQARPSQ